MRYCSLIYQNFKLIEFIVCIAMFYFVKRLLAFRIMTEPRTYRNYYHGLVKRLDTPRLKYHGLRYSFATRCIESNCDYRTVSVLLCHANIKTTLNLYVHPNMEQKKSASPGCSSLLENREEK